MAIDTSGAKIIKTFHEALNILDASEGETRLIIENSLYHVAVPNAPKSLKAVEAAMKKISVVRTKAIKNAFKHLRTHLPFQE
jgi:hypothetical protein